MKRRAIAALSGAAGLWLLLALNEVFLTPPLATPPVRLATGMARGFRDGSTITVNIGGDARVTGTFGSQPFHGKLLCNRTAFGRLMHWRSDYRIDGALADGRPLSAPLAWTGAGYKGAVFLGPHYKASGPVHVILKPL